MNASHHWFATIGFLGAGADKATQAVESRRMATIDAGQLAVLSDAERVKLAEHGEVEVEDGSSVVKLVSCNCNQHLIRVAATLDEDPSIIIRRRLLGMGSVSSVRDSGIRTVRPESQR